MSSGSANQSPERLGKQSQGWAVLPHGDGEHMLDFCSAHRPRGAKLGRYAAWLRHRMLVRLQLRELSKVVAD